MLEKYGDKIKSLYGPDTRTKYVILFLVGLNLASAYLLRDSPWWLIVLLSYVWGGTINHWLTLAVHELSHNLVFESQYMNILFGFIASIPHGLPTFGTFKKYHLIHHRSQGYKGIDPDLPTAIEGRFFTSKFSKFMFLVLQPFLYSFRPMIFYPGDISKEEIVQYAFQFFF
jgi:sphingolipid delta-4 desaturase